MNQSTTETQTVQTKTVIELDMRGYSDIARQRELDYKSPLAVAELNQEIQQFVDVGLQAVNLDREDVVKAVNGDNAVIVFDNPMQAHLFAEAVHKCTEEYNTHQQGLLAQRWFRIGCATGELHEENGKIAGIVIANAYRLEAKANPGEFLIDCHTYKHLKESLDHDPYLAPETVEGKRDELFDNCRRWQVIDRVSLLELVKEDSDIKSAVDDYFNYLDDTYKIIDQAHNYKILHDNFQNLENQLIPFQELLSFSLLGGRQNRTKIKRAIDKENSDKSKTLEYIKIIEEIIEKQIDNVEIDELIIDDWKSGIENIEKYLSEANQAREIDDYQDLLSDIIASIKEVIYDSNGMTILNKLLVDSVKQLKLQRLIDILDKVSILYCQKSQISNYNQLRDIKNNIESIKNINSELSILLDIHNDFQYFDDKCRLIQERLNDIEKEMNEFGENDIQKSKRSIERIFEKWDRLYLKIQRLSTKSLPKNEEVKQIIEQSTKEIIEQSKEIDEKRSKDRLEANERFRDLPFEDLKDLVNGHFQTIDDELNQMIERELKTEFEILHKRDAVLDRSQIQSL